MGTFGATRLCWVILGFLLLQGHHPQPTAIQLPTPQGDSPSLEPRISSTLANTGTPGTLPLRAHTQSAHHPGRVPQERGTVSIPRENTVTPELASKVPMETSKMELRWSTTYGQYSSLPGLTQAQTQKHTSALDTSQNITPKTTTMSLRTRDLVIQPSPTSETVLTVAAFGVISFIVILVVVVIVLVSVVSLRFKCRKNKESEDPQKPGNSGLSESCSTANGEKDRITLISMKNINTNNSKGCPSAEKVL
ncbi:endothelial cell-specific chemotaxis regulator isoform X2 [Erinaceus europaeus]|uniref:Endothelial cell-specific chemotaxis regulator isoform X2 n=1 Tax=Erinaceus europaeus TaxID=9365 RepID=A0ABM3WEH5_ERIEU|nr:endothelial cell-specific chemotaxis regulator isoform X2 [Erinaceus europaeus]